VPPFVLVACVAEKLMNGEDGLCRGYNGIGHRLYKLLGYNYKNQDYRLHMAMADGAGSRRRCCDCCLLLVAVAILCVCMCRLCIRKA
jgi:hypothetical protein